MAYEYVRQHYGVNPEVGAHVTTTDGKRPGVIAKERQSHNHYVYVRFEGVRRPLPCHPLDLIYLPAVVRPEQEKP